MKTNILILCALLVFSSCKKDILQQFTDDGVASTSKPPADLTKLVKTSVAIRPAGRDTTTTTYQYDNQGRLLRVQSKSVDDKYTYSSGYYSIDGKYEDKVYRLIGNKIDSLVTFSPNDTTAEKYVRDAQQQLVMVKRYHLTKNKSILLNTATNTYVDGNISKTVNSDGTSTVFTYTNTPLQDMFGTPYFFFNKFLTDTETYAGSPIKGTYQYWYQFDNLGRVIRKTFRGSFSMGTLLDETYTY